MQENTMSAAVAETETEQINYEGVLQLALEVGVGILSCGGSVSRVETAVDRICRAYGAEEVNAAAFPSMLIASVRTAGGHEYSYMKRVYSTSQNLALLEKYNQLSRDICTNKYPTAEGLKLVADLTRSKPRNKWITVLGSALVAGTYSIFFGGDIVDFFPAFLVAFIMAGLNELLSSRSLNAYATTFILSLVGGVLSVSLCKLICICGLTVHGSRVMIGTIMILVPGLLTTNAVRDMFTGDLMSGTFQLLNGVLITLVIAAGYGVAVLMLSKIADFVEPAARTGWRYYVYFLTSGTLGAAAVCLFFNMKLKRIGWAVLASLLTLGLYVGVKFGFAETEVFMPIFIATLFAAILSEFFARYIKTPATVILVPSIIAFVPGSSLYYTVQAMVEGDMASASSWGGTCMLTWLALAVGICVATIVFRIIAPVKLKFNRFNKALGPHGSKHKVKNKRKNKDD